MSIVFKNIYFVNKQKHKTKIFVTYEQLNGNNNLRYFLLFDLEEENTLGAINPGFGGGPLGDLDKILSFTVSHIFFCQTTLYFIQSFLLLPFPPRIESTLPLLYRIITSLKRTN